MRIYNKEENIGNEIGESSEKNASNHSGLENGKDSISKVNIEKFKDPSGLTIKRLNFGLWYLRHKKTLINIAYVVLGTIGIFTWFLFFKTFGLYIFVGMHEDEKLIYDMVNNPGISHEKVLQSVAKPLEINSIDIILNSDSTYDFVAKIRNPNKIHFSNFDYSFEFNNKTLGPYKGFILPNEEKFLLSMGEEIPRRPTSVNLIINNNWRKINLHEISNWESHRDNYIDFTSSNKVFYSPEKSNLTEKVNLSIVEFDIRNNSAYSYYAVDLDVMLYSRGKLVSVFQYPIEKIESEETRHINITWPVKVLQADKIEVIPNIDITKDNISYIP